MHTYDPLSATEVKDAVAAIDKFVSERTRMTYEESLAWVEQQKAPPCQLKAEPKVTKVTVEDLLDAAEEGEPGI